MSRLPDAELLEILWAHASAKRAGDDSTAHRHRGALLVELSHVAQRVVELQVQLGEAKEEVHALKRALSRAEVEARVSEAQARAFEARAHLFEARAHLFEARATLDAATARDQERVGLWARAVRRWWRTVRP